VLPAAHRLRSAAQFRAATRDGSKASRRSVVAYVLHSGDAEPAVAGLIVGRSVGNSVVRHRTSRRLRAILAGIVPGLPAGTTVVLRALPGAAVDPDLPTQVADAVDQAAARAARPR
jgi:ribonuclease P protein component